jgi:hypothetical protein
MAKLMTYEMYFAALWKLCLWAIWLMFLGSSSSMGLTARLE